MGRWEDWEFDLELPKREIARQMELKEVTGAREMGVGACGVEGKHQL